MVAVFIVSITTDISYLYYNVVGTFTVVGVGTLFSRFSNRPEAVT